MKHKAKEQREQAVLLGLVDLYIREGKPVGSNTLMDNGFDHLSSATIRNYFVKLEAGGYVVQQHSSGGRIPTPLAYKVYANAQLKDLEVIKPKGLKLKSREVAGYLQGVAEQLSEESGCAVFLTSPRFDQDFIVDVKLVGIDPKRCLCILVTDFGQIHTETLHMEKKLSSFSIKRIEAFFHYKMTGLDEPEMTGEEREIAQTFYNEVLLRHIVGYTNFSESDVYKTGFSKLLGYQEFRDATQLASGLSLFENEAMMRKLFSEAEDLTFWIGEELSHCSVIAIPYRINHKVVGQIALLGPNRIDYKKIFPLLKGYSEVVSENLTKSMYKFKISYREPKSATHVLESGSALALMSLEDKRRDNV